MAGSGGTVAIDDLILSQGCVKEQGELVGSCPRCLAPIAPCLTDPDMVWLSLYSSQGPSWVQHRKLVLVSLSCDCDTPSSVSKCVTQAALIRHWVPFSWWQLGWAGLGEMESQGDAWGQGTVV